MQRIESIETHGHQALKELLGESGTFSPQDWSELEAVLRKVKFPKGSVIHSESKVCRTIYFIISGCIRIYYVNDNGQEISSDFFFDRHIFTAFSSFWKQSPSKENICALEDTDTLAVSYQDLHALLQKNATWRAIHSNLLIKLILHTYERDEILAMKDLAERFKKMSALRPGVFLRVKQMHLASFLGMTHETFSRIKTAISRENQMVYKR